MISMLLQNHQAEPATIQARVVRPLQLQKNNREIRDQLLQMVKVSMIRQNHRKSQSITPVVTK